MKHSTNLSRIISGTLAFAMLVFSFGEHTAVYAQQVDSFHLQESSQSQQQDDKDSEGKEEEKKEEASEQEEESSASTADENVENPQQSQQTAPDADSGEQQLVPLFPAQELTEGLNIETDRDYYFLSDIPYIKGESHSSYKGIQLDKNPDGKVIELFIDGERNSFEKGIGAHANSNVVFDIGDYSDIYTNFTAYLGVDAKQGRSGNGVKFTIFVSDDKITWDEIYKSGVLKGDSESEFVDLDVSGKKYLKLSANDNGANGNDHSVYGDARLKKKDYNIHDESKGPFKRIGEYDRLLSENTIEDNLENNIDLIYKRELVNRIGYNTLNRLYEDADYKEAIDFLCEEKPLSYFINGGPLIRDGGSYPENTIIAFAEIYNQHKEKLRDNSENDFYLRLAISIADAYSYPDNVRFWMDKKKDEDPLARFDTYVELSEPAKAMDNAGKTTDWSGEQFRRLPIALMRWVVDARMNEDEFDWLADYALKTRDTIDKGPQKFLDAYTYIQYKNSFGYNDEKYYDPKNHEKWNEKYGFDEYFDDYGEDIHRLWIVFEEGAVCGGLAKTYANLAEVFGRPSVVVGQPGHAATVTLEYDKGSGRYWWRIQNDISGWAQSHSEYSNYLLNWGLGKGESSSYTPMAYDAVNNYDNFVDANKAVLLASSYQQTEDKEKLYRDAIEIQQINLDAWEGLVRAKLSDESLKSEDFLKLSKEIMKALTFYPLPMENLLNSIKDKITDTKDIAEFDMLRIKTLNRAVKATLEDVYQPNISSSMAKALLNQNSDHLASFSFDGEDAGKIVLNSKYDSSSIRVRYSLDNEKTWEETSEHKITLSKKQLDSLSADNDIKVGLVGVNDIYTIDLQPSKSPQQNNLYKNDYENLFITSDKYLEYSTDSGKTWHDYMPDLTSNTRFEGKQDVLLRYKSHETYIQSRADSYTFNEDSSTPERSYLQLQNVQLESFSSQQAGAATAAKNLIDGNINTHWHSDYGITDEKEYVVSFKQPALISALEYFPHSANGRWRDIEVYSSADSKQWEKIGEAHLANDDSVKSIVLNTAHPIKYLKIKGLNSYGNNPKEENKYFSGRMLNFYEDTTKKPSQPVQISYSTREKTNKDVVASITLPKGYTMAEGSSSYTFKENGEHTFKYKDRENNIYTAFAKVTWIRKAVLTADVAYSETKPTYGSVTATIGNFPYSDVYVSNNNHSLSFTFSKNGDFFFELADSYGNTGRVKASVQNIIGEESKVYVEYSPNDWTDGPVTAVLKSKGDEKFTVLNNKGNKEYTFLKNESFVFEVENSNGIKYDVAAAVDWIDPSKSKVTASYSTTDETTDAVTVTLSVDPDSHEIINNDGSGSYTFTKNGSFVFNIRLRDSQKVVFYEVKVNNIRPKASYDSDEDSDSDSDTDTHFDSSVQPPSEQTPSQTKPNFVPIDSPQKGSGTDKSTDTKTSYPSTLENKKDTSDALDKDSSSSSKEDGQSENTPLEDEREEKQDLPSEPAAKEDEEEKSSKTGVILAVLSAVGASFAFIAWGIKSNTFHSLRKKYIDRRRRR